MKTRGFIFYDVTRFADSFGETQFLPVGAVKCVTFTNAVAVWPKVTFMEWRLDAISFIDSVCIQITIIFAVSCFSNNSLITVLSVVIVLS